jgi:hypothetical protein
MKYILKIVLVLLLIINFTELKSEDFFAKNNFLLGENDSLPKDIPPILFHKIKEVSPGYFFLTTIPDTAYGNEFANYNLIIDKDGKISAYNKIGNNLDAFSYNLMQNVNGLLSYTEIKGDKATLFITDTALTKKDSIITQKTVWNTPFFKILANGHYLMVKHEQEYIDLSDKISNSDPNTLVVYSDIYELDSKKNIVFYWRALDYLNIEDSYNSINYKYSPPQFNFNRITGVEQDATGNLLVSQANLSEISKINKQTGDFIWRLGGKNNQFTFIDENEENSPVYFSYQNDITRLANGNITMFDNGFQHKEQVSRAVEYNLDEGNKVCKLVWEYKSKPGIFSKYNGSVQRQANGNTVIGWGNASLKGDLAMTEVDRDNNVLIEVNLPYGYSSPKITKSSWSFSSPVGKASAEILRGNTYNFNKGNQITCTKMLIKELVEIFYPMIFVNKYNFAPVNPEFEDTIPPIVFPTRLVVTLRGLISVDVEARFNTSCLGITEQPQNWKVYSRKTPGSGVFQQVNTVYDEKTGELVINTSDFGEFIFGLPQQPVKPKQTLLIAPQNQANVNQSKPVELRWSPHGYFSDCQVQVAEDFNFKKIILDTAGLKSINFDFNKIESGKSYYWRVKSNNSGISGDWSEIREFTSKNDFIDLTVPDGGQRWLKDSLRKIIRWDWNVDDKVRIELLKDGMVFSVIADSAFCPNGAYGWDIPDYVPYDSSYKIRVTGINTKLETESQNVFAIVDPLTSGVNDEPDGNVSLGQNAPNPFSNDTRIEFSIPSRGRVLLTVCNILGEKIATLIDNELSAGEYKSDWNSDGFPSGQYYYKLDYNGKVLTRKMTIIK